MAKHKTTPGTNDLEPLISSRALPVPALLDFENLCDFLGWRKDRSSRLRFWRGARSGHFPSPVKNPGGSRIFWRRQEIERWLSELPRATYSKTIDHEAGR